MIEVFGLYFEFDRTRLHEIVDRYVSDGIPGYVCALDGNNIANAISDRAYADVLNSAIVNNSDSTWVTTLINRIYGMHYEHYCSSDMFVNMLEQKKYRQYYLGSSTRVLDSLKANLCRYDPAIAEMPFVELPFCGLDEFDYAAIAADINDKTPDVIWVSLGAPKQEEFMARLLPYLNRGVMFGVGAIFNFYSTLDDVPRRAPRWMIRLHLEFLYRLFSEPRKQWGRCRKILATIPVAYFKEKHKTTRI